MAADYDFRRKPNEKGDEELQPLYPRIVSKGTLIANDCFVKYPKRPPLPKVTWQVSWYLFKKKYLTI